MIWVACSMVHACFKQRPLKLKGGKNNRDVNGMGLYAGKFKKEETLNHQTFIMAKFLSTPSTLTP